MKSWIWIAKLLLLTLFVQMSACTTSGSGKSETSPEDRIVLLSSNSGFGGTGRTQPEQQVAMAEPDSSIGHSMQLDSGFGGTGRTSKGFGGTGVIGTIEQFGSIWVNGIEIGLGQKTRIHSNLPGKSAELQASDLRIGQQVWLETHLDSEKTTTADIHVYYPLAGQIEAIQTQDMATEIQVNGQRVYVDESTRLANNLNLKVGEFVRISGLPVYRHNSDERENAWQATLVESEKMGMTWLKTHPDVVFSDHVNRVVMQDNWLKAYHAGEFTQIPPGLSSQPKIKLEGPNKNQTGSVSSAGEDLSSQAFSKGQSPSSTGLTRNGIDSLQRVTRPAGFAGSAPGSVGRGGSAR